MSAIDTTGRHFSTVQVARWFEYDHLAAGTLRAVSVMSATFAEDIIATVPDGPELTTGLRKLLEAKDCFVRAAIAGKES